jgi:hypothetical protein
MDRARYDELIKKRDDVGLTDDEANELGRLMADERGERYGSADNPPEDVAAERDAVEAEEKAEIEEGERADRDVDESV